MRNLMRINCDQIINLDQIQSITVNNRELVGDGPATRPNLITIEFQPVADPKCPLGNYIELKGENAARFWHRLTNAPHGNVLYSCDSDH